MLLDCDAATLTVWVNGERRGVMARPGDSRVAKLVGPLRWAVDLERASVAIEGPLEPPEPEAGGETAAAAATAQPVGGDLPQIS